MPRTPLPQLRTRQLTITRINDESTEDHKERA